MADVLWIHLVLFMILKLQVEATSGQYSYTTVRPGANVTLPCYDVINQDTCEKTNWTFKDKQNKTVELVKYGQNQMNTATSDRLSLTERCSLVIQNVTVTDVGLYTCQQQGQSSNGLVYLSVVTMTEQKATDKVIVTCSVLGFGQCEHKVKWLLQDKDVNPENVEKISCSASVSFLESEFNTTLNSLTCEVTQPGEEKLNFPFRPQASDRKTAWWLIAGGLVALLVTAVVIVVRRHKARKGKKTEENNADPEDGVSYASVGFKKKSSSKAQVQVKGEADDDAVTYSTVNTAAASAAPGIVYAAINRPNNPA